MKLFRSVAGFCAILILFVQPASAATQKTPEVADALNQWVAAVESRSVDKIMALYDKDAIMFSAFAIKPLKSRKELRDYYKKVVDNPDVNVDVTESHPRKFDGGVALNSGLYTLSYTQDGEPVELPSRFSFTYVLKDGKWMIVDHHSSKVPLAGVE